MALAGVLALGAALRLWDLARNGYGTEYYTAGVRSMLDSLHNFAFNAFDPAGFVSLDKPPLAFWIQVASAKLFGFAPLSILLPQVLEGVAAIALLHHLVARRFGAAAGLLAALFLAVTPISVAVDRSSNTESCLILTLLLAAWPLTVATERGSLRLLALAMALVGVAFNVKMVAAFMVLPGFALSYLIGAPIAWPRRVGHLAVGGVILTFVSLSWVVAYDLTPPDSRPYAGSTQRNSMLELAFQAYGLERLAGRAPADEGAAPPQRAGSPGWYEARRVPPGALRLVDPRLAGQVGWLLPLAFGALAAGWSGSRAAGPALALWGGWAVACAIVLSAASGVFHSYYVVLLAPPLSALAGIAVAALWSVRRRGAWLLPAVLALTGLWQAWLQLGHLGLPDEPGLGARLLALAERVRGDWRIWLMLALLVGSLGGALALASARRPRAGAAVAATMVGIAALLATPTTWALSTVVTRTDVWFPFADAALLTDDDSPTTPRVRRTAASPASRRLADFLAANHAGERYALATLTALQAAPLIILTGAPVIALGGYSGTDPIVTPDQLVRWVETGDLRFALLTVNGRGGETGAGRRRAAPTQALAAWIRANGTRVDPAHWRVAEETPPRPTGRAANPMAWGDLYDLRPSAGAIRAVADADPGR